MRVVYSAIIYLLFGTQIILAQNSKLKFKAIDTSACGLNFVYGVSPISSRYPTGTGFPAKVSIAGLPGNAKILSAYLYTINTHTNGNPNSINFRFTNSQSIISNFNNQVFYDEDVPKCQNENSTRMYKIDVTNSISGNGVYRISLDDPNIEKEVDGVFLIIIYKEANATYEGHLTIHDGLMIGINGNTVSHTMNYTPVCNTELFSKSFALLGNMHLLRGFSHSSTLNNNTTQLVPNTFFQVNMDSMKGITKNQSSGVYAFKSDDVIDVDCFALGLTGLYYKTTICRNCVCDFKSDFGFKNACVGDSLPFTNLSTAIKGGPITKYTWDFGDGNKEIMSSFKTKSHFYKNKGKYTVSFKIENDDNPPCFDIVSKEVEVLEPPTILLGTEDQKAFILNKKPGEKLVWDFDANLTSDTIDNLTPGFHYLTVSNATNCSALDSINVLPKPNVECTSCCFKEVKIPNAFNPNNSNANFQNFLSAELNCFQKIDFMIINRWGKVLYQSSDIQSQWDGKAEDGKELETGLYFIRLNYTTQNGDVGNLIRSFSLVR